MNHESMAELREFSPSPSSLATITAFFRIAALSGRFVVIDTVTGHFHISFISTVLK
jgi:hypothetical protein